MITVAHENQNPAAWQRLANLLVARRVYLGWHTRRAFLNDHADRISHDRTVSALEKAERMNFRQETLALIEILYQWRPGSIDAILAGGDPRPVEGPEPAAAVDLPAASAARMECLFIIDRLGEDQLAEALAVLRGMERRQR